MRATVVSLLLGVGLAASGCSRGPEGAYTRFADAWAANRVAEALTYVGSEEAREAVQRRNINAVMHNMIQTPMGSSHSGVVTTRGSGPDEVVLQADQVVMYNPPGVESALRPSMAARFHHTLTLARTAEGWKVTAFDTTLVKTEEIGH